MRKSNKVQKEGHVLVALEELDGFRFQDMRFFDKWVPEGCELVEVGFNHEFGIYDQGDEAHIVVYWRIKEKEL